MPSNHRYLVFMLLKYLKFLHFPNIMYFERIVSWTSKQPISIDWIPSHLINCVIVGLECVNFLPTFWVPYFNLVVFAASRYNGFLRVPVASFDIWVMAFKLEFLLSSGEVKDFSSSIVWARQELEGTLRKREISDTVLVVSNYSVFETDFIVRVNDCALLVPTNKVLFIVGPTHGLDSVLMDRGTLLKLKIESTPNYNLTTACSSYYPFASLHPLNCK